MLNVRNELPAYIIWQKWPFSIETRCFICHAGLNELHVKEHAKTWPECTLKGITKKSNGKSACAWVSADKAAGTLLPHNKLFDEDVIQNRYT